MAKHKAPTQITIASSTERTVMHELVDRYWKLGLGLALVATAAILVPAYNRQRSEMSHHEVWDELRAQADLGSGLFTQIQGGSPATLSTFAEEHRNSEVGAWAKSLEVGSLLQAKRLAEAEKAADDLAKEWPDHLLVKGGLYTGVDGRPVSLAEHVQQSASALQTWEKAHPFLFSNPELPADAPRVRIHTNKGPIVVGLYIDRTPKHAENFLELCKQGYYDHTRFHRVVRGSLIQGGDPNSIAGEPDTWGQGGPEKTIEAENDPRLRHFKGALCAWKAPGATESHGSQFQILSADQPQMDGQNVVFGQVLEGFGVIEAIESGAVVGDRPQDPATIESVEIL